jgi:NRPS condensation-like uncharacterized protein
MSNVVWKTIRYINVLNKHWNTNLFEKSVILSGKASDILMCLINKGTLTYLKKWGISWKPSDTLMYLINIGTLIYLE